MIDLIATLHSTAVTSTVINNNEVSLAIIQHKVDFSKANMFLSRWFPLSLLPYYIAINLDYIDLT